MKLEFTKGNIPPIVVESCGHEGVRRIAGKVAEDIEKVSGVKPAVVSEQEITAKEGGWII